MNKKRRLNAAAYSKRAVGRSRRVSVPTVASARVIAELVCAARTPPPSRASAGLAERTCANSSVLRKSLGTAHRMMASRRPRRGQPQPRRRATTAAARTRGCSTERCSRARSTTSPRPPRRPTASAPLRHAAGRGALTTVGRTGGLVGGHARAKPAMPGCNAARTDSGNAERRVQSDQVHS